MGNLNKFHLEFRLFRVSVYSVFKNEKTFGCEYCIFTQKNGITEHTEIFSDTSSIHPGNEFDDCWCQFFVERAIGICVIG